MTTEGIDYSEDICKECGWYCEDTDYCYQRRFETDEKFGERFPTLECVYFICKPEEYYKEALEDLRNIKLLTGKAKNNADNLYNLFLDFKGNLESICEIYLIKELDYNFIKKAFSAVRCIIFGMDMDSERWPFNFDSLEERIKEIEKWMITSPLMHSTQVN